MEEEEEVDSLFEGMVLFNPNSNSNSNPNTSDPTPTPSRLDSDSNHHHDQDKKNDDEEDPNMIEATASEPLDENLFSDLTVQFQTPEVAVEQEAEEQEEDAIIKKTTSRQNSSSRKKKRAAGLRIGYGRGDHDNIPDNPVDEFRSVKPEQQLEAVIAEKLSRARDLASSVSYSRKESIARRRAAAQNLNLASINYSNLDKQLQEACEAEDFDAAQRLSDELAASHHHMQALLAALRDAEAHCDAVDSKMHQLLQSQIDAEEECASLLHKFATDASNNADIVFKAAEQLCSTETDKWLSSTEALEIKKMELEIESHIIHEAGLVLSTSIDCQVEDDKREKESLCKKKDILMDELEKLLALVKEKELEIAQNDSDIKQVEEKIANVVSGFEGMQSNIHAKSSNLQESLSQIHLESETLSTKKAEIDTLLAQEQERGAKLREVARASAEEAEAYQQVAALRKSLMSSVLKSREDKVRLAKTEEKLSKDVQLLQQDVSASRTSLQELSSRKSSIQQDIASSKQKIIFIDKRIPELEAEKKVAATARNFKEAARIAAEAKSLNVEKDGILIDMEKAVLELDKLEEEIKETVNRLQETQGHISSKEKEVATTRFQRLVLISGIAKAEKEAALELGDVEEANLLLAEAEAADSEAKKLEPIYNFKVEEIESLPKHFISMELVSHLGKKQLEELAASFKVLQHDNL